ncbi:uncharacterized protein XM38_043460 [Halomicronema hongdechloris C2206]|uniref:Phytase-like domain-containing protein n=1 Tax=Halomicronema hongdechloris C2206 TaxID=1641165 RepID=A0A1Z3HST8_9CYAN|nr:esterase-like activity of phytase family protein [Halomicronema hongdechloris]ASC73381.1 uncharacterized protein XM38_043460 [Halomicronema hongdechloris C2206]
MVRLRSVLVLCLALALVCLSSCSLPRVSAEERLFLDLSTELLDVYELPTQMVQGVPLGGLSALAYDAQTDRLYALCDDRQRPRLYVLSLSVNKDARGQPRLAQVAIANVIFLKNSDGEPYPANTVDPEGLALSPRQTVFITSEGVPATNSPPFIAEFNRDGQALTSFRLPDRFLPDDPQQPTRGVQENLGLEALTLNAVPSPMGMVDPFRLFTASESALVQDYDDDPSHALNSRFLHYLIGPEQATLLAEHLYPLELEPQGAIVNGLTELLALDQGGHFLALERSFGLKGFQNQLFQMAIGGATDTSTMASLDGVGDSIRLIRKRLLFDFATIDGPQDNLEGMSLGPRLPDGSRSLLLVSDDNFNADQATLLFLFRLQ